MDSNNVIDSSEESQANTVHNSHLITQQDANGNPAGDIVRAATALLLGNHVIEVGRR